MKRCLGALVAILAVFGVALMAAGTASAAKKGNEPLVVCKFGCKYKTIQKAVDKSGKNATILIEPGKYKEGVIVEGKKHNGLTIAGDTKNAKKVILEGKNAKSEDGLAQNGIEAIDVKGITIKNLTARNYATNGIFIRDSNLADGDKSLDCDDYLVKNTFTSYNRAYGVYAFGCVSGRMTKSTGVGHGDSAFYVGATPPTKGKPKWTVLDKLDAHTNIQAFSGTNSRYIEIKDSNFYNNGSGVVPNTLDSEPYEPATIGKIHDNNIFWNNYNYYLPDSKVQTISNGLGQLGDQTINFPTGVGVVLFGTTGWEVYDNEIFGHFKWGAAVFSDAVGNEGNDAESTNNSFVDNQMGRGGTDTNAVDFFNDGSGSGNCFQGNTSSTFDPSGSATNGNLYPTCPAPAPPASGTGSSAGDAQQFGDLAGYVLTTPPSDQECSWTKHSHPPFMDYKPDEVAGANCSD